MLELLREFHRDKLALRQRHAAAAQLVGNYDFNNTYQYVIAREDMHLRWLIDAIIDMTGQPDEVPLTELNPSGKAPRRSERSSRRTATAPTASSTSGGRASTR